MEMSYPQYRRYKNGKSYFRIVSPTEFEEIQALGQRWFFQKFTVKILPDRNFIQDMTFAYQEHWEVVSADEFEVIRSLSRDSGAGQQT